MADRSLATSMQFDTFGFTATELARKQAHKEHQQRYASIIPIAFMLYFVQYLLSALYVIILYHAYCDYSQDLSQLGVSVVGLNVEGILLSARLFDI